MKKKYRNHVGNLSTLDIAKELIYSIQGDGNDTESRHIARGFHSVDIYIHNNKEIKVEKMGEWEYKGEVNL